MRTSRSVRARGRRSSWRISQGEGPGEILSDVGFEELLQSTLDYWRRWLSNSTYQGRWREIVHRSALVLKLMVYDPTGALVASPTMGLPERIGGERNWLPLHLAQGRGADALRPDLRRLRDEARHFMGWLGDRCHEDEDGLLQPLYGIDGRKDITEMELSHLSGT